ncbi:hypothetical protein Btru_006692 [Bulinus truncatus]|nr:hypothetical protein Btru_006692 [Bulinus truncatus]
MLSTTRSYSDCTTKCESDAIRIDSNLDRYEIMPATSERVSLGKYRNMESREHAYVCVYNMATQLFDSDSEDELPPGWEERVTTDGKVYYAKLKISDFHFPPVCSKIVKSVLSTDLPYGWERSFETARSLALYGAMVVMACRNLQAAHEARAKILQEQASAKVEVMHLDLASLKSVKMLADQYEEKGWPLHILVLNAGVFGIGFSLTGDNLETTFQVNHLSHFYLTKLLVNTLMKSAPARVVVVSSESHRVFRIQCNQAWERGRAKPVNCTRTIEAQQQGAATTVYCAVAEELNSVGGLYFNNCCRCQPSKQADSKTLAVALWSLSEQILNKKLKPAKPVVKEGL